MTKLKIKKRFLLLSIGILVSFHCFSQADSTGDKNLPSHIITAAPPPPEEIFYKGSVEGGGGIVYPFTNKALRLSLSGIYYFHLSANYILAPHIFGGAEFEDTRLGNVSTIAAYNTFMCVYSAGLKIGYYTYMQNDILLCYSLSFGPSLITYIAAPNPAPKQESIFMTPNILAGYRVNDELRIGLELSYVFMNYRFDPAYTGIGQYVTYSQSNTTAITTYLEWGFGFYYAFAEAKK